MSLLRGLFGRRQADVPESRRLSAGELPERLYAIGDVHGCLDQLQRLEALIVEDTQGVTGEKWLVHLGDYIDRGPASAQVLDHLLAPPPAGFSRICLAGNHEHFLLGALSDPDTVGNWLEFGGVATLLSYGLQHAQIDRLRRGGRHARLQLLQACLPDEHLDFLRGLPVLLTVPGYVFVHAGLRPGVPLDRQSDEDLLWIRHEFLDADHDFGAVVVHGHTPVPEPSVLPRRVCIDTGCFMTGRLTALRIAPGVELRLLST
jgi:serine/threonine protein phosphatase 1